MDAVWDYRKKSKIIEMIKDKNYRRLFNPMLSKLNYKTVKITQEMIILYIALVTYARYTRDSTH